MTARLTIAGCLALAVAVAVTLMQARPDDDRPFSEEERTAILAHGPWPVATSPDPSNRVSGHPGAIDLGRRLFADKRLSAAGDRACVSCHDPARQFADGRSRSLGVALGDRNAIALANLRLNRWYGWSGDADSLWAQSLRAILDARELGANAALVRERLSADMALAQAYASLFGSALAADAPDLGLVNLAKALAAFQETITSARTPFDDLRDALERGDRDAVGRHPAAARRGLQIFVGKGRCNFCHFGPNFTHGEFDDVGVPFFAETGRVDKGRHGGIATLRASPFNLLGDYNDDSARTTAAPTRHVEAQHRNWGEFRVPSLRNVAATGPYMHHGSLATLDDVMRHYSEVDIERLHGDDGARLIRPLRLTAREAADLISFLASLTSAVSAEK